MRPSESDSRSSSPSSGADPSSAGAAPAAAALDVIVHYHHPVKAPLLRDVLLPLAASCAADGLAAHVERHWLHGPHLRLRLEGPAARVDAAAAAAASRVRDWLRTHPSHGELTDAQLLEHASAAGRAELIAPPYGPIVPDNTVRLAPVDDAPLRGLLGAAGADLRDDLLRAGLDPLRAGTRFLGDHGDTADARVQLAVVALAAHAGAHPGGLAGGHYSYVSHLEDFLFHEDPGGGLRERFERHAERAGDAVARLVGRIRDGGARGWERAWTTYSADARQLTQSRFDAGADLHGDPDAYRARAAATGDAAAALRWNHEERTGFSDFHHLLRRSDPDGRMWNRPDYLVHRAGTNALYRLLAICDVRPLERYLAAHLVIRSVPALTGCDWRTEIGAAVDAVEGRS
ncbi:lantibiotic dehydratase C-terminal domain-containing protein [Streptomyces sp. NPDC098789]|uniref:lantibiotic dehydratase C-terminal domain-containing protein n=1 Tax=Streptomyces sp. NPDC098789 TaxID=3366098 RepID=UPI0038101E9A